MPSCADLRQQQDPGLAVLEQRRDVDDADDRTTGLLTTTNTTANNTLGSSSSPVRLGRPLVDGRGPRQRQVRRQDDGGQGVRDRRHHDRARHARGPGQLPDHDDPRQRPRRTSRTWPSPRRAAAPSPRRTSGARCRARASINSQGDAFMTKYETRSRGGTVASGVDLNASYDSELLQLRRRDPDRGGERMVWIFDPGFCDVTTGGGTGEYWTSVRDHQPEPTAGGSVRSTTSTTPRARRTT